MTTSRKSVSRHPEYRALAKAVAANPADPVPQAALTDWLMEHNYTRLVADRLVAKVADRKAAAIRRAVRQHVGCRANMPVDIIDGDAAPEITGETWYYTTQAGTRVRHPNAYKRVAKSAVLVYHGSTLGIEVGRDWIAAKVTV